MNSLLERPDAGPTSVETQSDAALNRVVQVIIQNFNGDTKAFFNTIAPRPHGEDRTNQDVAAIKRFTKAFGE